MLDSSRTAVLDPALLREIDTVPELDRFAGVDEIVSTLTRLAAEFPGAASLRRIGTSRLGEPIPCLTVGDGPHHALVVAMPHPNEPIGGLTALHLARRMCEDAALRRASGYTWHIVGCVDPDGTRLNEEWFAGPFTRTHYSRHFYRPAGDEQVEWTFPFAYKRCYFDQVMPETLAWMRLIDQIRPAFMTSLHNAEVGGAFYYVNRDDPELFATLKALPQRYGVALDAGEPEHPSIRRLDTAIFQLPSMRDLYDYLERLGQDPTQQIGGASSDAYAEPYGTLCLAVELPYWWDPLSCDHTVTEIRYGTVLRDTAEGIGALHAVMAETLEEVSADLVTNSPFLRATRFFVPTLAAMAEADTLRAAGPEGARPATVAEHHSCQALVHCYRLRFGGMLLRALEAEIAVGNGTPAIRRRAAAFGEIYAGWCTEAESATPEKTIPIRHLVSIQYGTILAGARRAMARPGMA